MQKKEENHWFFPVFNSGHFSLIDFVVKEEKVIVIDSYFQNNQRVINIAKVGFFIFMFLFLISIFNCFKYLDRIFFLCF